MVEIQTFEQLAGVEIIIDDTPEIVTISSFIQEEKLLQNFWKLLTLKEYNQLKLKKS